MTGFFGKQVSPRDPLMHVPGVARVPEPNSEGAFIREATS